MRFYYAYLDVSYIYLHGQNHNITWDNTAFSPTTKKQSLHDRKCWFFVEKYP